MLSVSFVASLDRKRLGADFWGEAGSRSEAFPIKASDHTGATGRAGAGLNLTFGSPHSGSPRGGRQTQLRESSMGNECSLRFVQSCGRSHSYELLSKRSRCPLRVEE